MRAPTPRRAVRAASTGLVTLGLVLVPLAPGALAVGALPAVQPDGTQVTLFNINDFHGRISSSAKPLACTLTTERSALGASGNSVLLSAGDNVGASEFASYIQDDDPTIDYLNAIGLKASALGNHEYDKGQDDLRDHIEARADWTHLASNIYTTSGERATTPYTVVDAGGVKVAVVGADTQETPALTSPAGLTGLEFRDPVTSVNTAITELEAQKSAGTIDYDVVAVEYHEGSASSAPAGSDPGGGELYTRIVNETSPAADVIFNGHTHQSYSFEAPVPGEPGETRAIMQTGSYGANLGKVTLSVDGQGDWDTVPATTGLVATPATVPAGASCLTDPVYTAAAKISDDAKAKGDIEAAKPVGSISEDLTTAYAPADAAYDANGVWRGNGKVTKGDDRASSSTLSDALADSMVWATQQDSYAGTRATIGVMNPGGVRADLFHARSGTETEDGVVSFAEANNVVPFVNNLSTVDLTGEQFLTVLNEQWQRDVDGNIPSRNYLALGLSKNVSYTADASAPEGSRITSVTIDGEPLDPAATYTVVAANFLTAGGDNFRGFTEGSAVTDTGLLDRDAWIDYLAAHPDLAPDYSQRGIGFQVANPAAAGTAADPWKVTVSKLESRSLGAPRIDEVTVTVDGTEFTAPYTRDAKTGAWSAQLDVTAGQCTDGDTHSVTVTATPDTGTAAGPITAALPACGPFVDVKPDNMFVDEITWLADSGITTGYPDGTFRPLEPVGRDAMAAYLYRLAGSPAITPPRTQPFRDVTPQTEHYDAIIWAYQQGITTGYPDRTFRPTASIDRNAMAAFVYRYAGSPEVADPAEAPFPDVAPGDPFAKEISWTRSQGITLGYPDGTFHPFEPVNRDATAAFLYRMSAEKNISFRSAG